MCDIAAINETVEAVVAQAEALLQKDEEINRALGRAGADAMQQCLSHREKVRVLTHCNTGALATACYGTALGVVKTLFERGVLERVYFTETRPYNQGARLTSFECAQEGLPATLICDSAAAFAMAQGNIDAVIVGADRVACNGDTANKIGTYMLAVAAKEHNIPFFIAAPTATIDQSRASGDGITIEERSSEEITHFAGTQIAASGVEVSNRAFDVTPCSHITAVATENGAVFSQGDRGARTPGFIDMLSVCNTADLHKQQKNLIRTKGGFVALNEALALEYAAQTEDIASVLGGDKQQWSCKEVGDGNINFVYIIGGPSGEIALKQGLPYVRVVGGSMPLTQQRVEYEANALKRCAALCPDHTPAVYHTDNTMRTLTMQYLKPPHAILRGCLVEGQIFPHLGEHMGKYLAQTLFNTSPWATSGPEYRRAAHNFGPNTDMCHLTENVSAVRSLLSS